MDEQIIKGKMTLSRPVEVPGGIKVQMTLNGTFYKPELDEFSQAYLQMLELARSKNCLLHMAINAVHFNPTLDASKYLFMGKAIWTHPNMGIQVIATSSYTAYAVVNFIGNLLFRSNVMIARDVDHATEMVKNGQKPVLMMDTEAEEVYKIMDHLVEHSQFDILN